MFDGVPTRVERIAAAVAIGAAILLVPIAALGYGIAAVFLLFAALACAPIATARVDLESLRSFGLRSVDDDEDDPAAERYRERRRRGATRIERSVAALETGPRFDRVLAIVLAVAGLGALALVATADEYTRTTGRLLVVGLIALNCALVAVAGSSIDAEADADEE